MAVFLKKITFNILLILQEEYTSILTCGKADLEAFYGRELIPADRDLVESGADLILDGADSSDVAFLVNFRFKKQMKDFQVAK